MIVCVPVVERKPQLKTNVLVVITNSAMQSSLLLNIFQVNLSIITCIKIIKNFKCSIFL